MVKKPPTEKKSPPIEKILKAIYKTRAGKIERRELETLHAAELLTAAIHGSPPLFHFVFINFKEGRSADFVKIIHSEPFLQKLPKQASLRLVTERFGIDAIISGHLESKTWFQDKMYDDYAKYIEDWCQLSFKHTKRYRWKESPTNTISPLEYLTDLTVDKAEDFLKRDEAATRLVYDLRKAPILSCYALITSNESYEDLWRKLGELRNNIRDLFHERDFDDGTGLGIIKRSVVDGPRYLAVCEFDNFEKRDRSIWLDCAMNQAYHWHAKVRNLGIIEEVRLIPCVVVKDSYEILDEAARLRPFDPKFSLRSVHPDDDKTPKIIPCPVWTYLICGGKGGGKSVTAFYLLAELLNNDPAYDVIFVNYKISDSRGDLGARPSQTREVFDYVGVIHQRTGKWTSLVKPTELKETILQSKLSGAYYTEGCADITVEFILNEIISAYAENKKNGSARPCVIIFDEILNQKDRNRHMSVIVDKSNELRSQEIYLAVIGQQFTKILEATGADAYMNESTVIVAGELSTDADLGHFKRLLRRAPDFSELDEKPLLDDVQKPGQGRFILLPRNNKIIETAVRIKAEKVKLRPDNEKSEKHLAEMSPEWIWGATVKDEV